VISIKVSLPKTKFARKKWLDSIASKQRAQSLPRLRKLFKQTTFGWSNKPDFGWSQSKNSEEITLSVYPTGPYSDKWNLLNKGSPKHEIFPKNQGGFLRFRPGYRSATVPGSLQSRRKYRSGPYQFAKYIQMPMHPGFKARKFTEIIAQEFASKYGIEIQEAITEVARR
jgi:hypothetical protein